MIEKFEPVQFIEAEEHLRIQIPQAVIQKGDGREMNHTSSRPQKTVDIPESLANIKDVFQSSKIEDRPRDSVMLLRQGLAEVDIQRRLPIHVQIGVVVDAQQT